MRVVTAVSLAYFAVSIPIFLGMALYADKTKTDDANNGNRACAASWSACNSNDEIIRIYLKDSRARSACKTAAYKAAKYGEPELPRLFYFGTFLTGNEYSTSGLAILIEDEAKFQNAFGAMANVKVWCEYDLRADKVSNLTVEPR